MKNPEREYWHGAVFFLRYQAVDEAFKLLLLTFGFDGNALA